MKYTQDSIVSIPIPSFPVPLIFTGSINNIRLGWPFFDMAVYIIQKNTNKNLQLRARTELQPNKGGGRECGTRG